MAALVRRRIGILDAFAMVAQLAVCCHAGLGWPAQWSTPLGQNAHPFLTW